MDLHTQFRLHRDCRILTPNAPGLSKVLDNVRQGNHIVSGRFEIPTGGRGTMDQWVFCATAGSTGTPKVVQRAPITWISSFEQTQSHFGIGPTDIYAVLGGLEHSLSLYAVLEALHVGADVCCLAGHSPKVQAMHIADFGVSVLYATPTQMSRLLLGHDIVFDQVRYIFLGGGTVTGTLRQAIKSNFPQAHIHEFYGSSEASFVTITDAMTPCGSVGRAYPNVDIKIVNPANDGVGLVAVQSDYICQAYVGSETLNLSSDGYLLLGEMGYFDQNRNLFLKGRFDRMITVGDINVYPESVETLVASLAGVKLCAVIADIDEKRGHVLHCFVEADDRTIDRDIRQLCRDALGAAYVPKFINYLDDMPVTPAGKPDLAALKLHIVSRN